MNMKKFFAPSAWRLGGAARRAATALLLCVMTMTVQTAWAQNGNWSDHKAASFSTINESAKTISITTEAELALLAYNTCNGTDYSGYTITLTKDLNMSAHYWDKSIGTENSNNSGNKSFRGTFNGAGHTISCINISSGSYKGLFGFVGQSQKPGTIQNVTLASSTITGDNSVGGIVGYLLNGTVSNCHVLSSVSILASSDNSGYLGGIVGQTYPNKTNTNATIENCTSAALVTDNGHNNCSSYGGIVGYNYYYSDTYFSKVTGCFYYGTAVSASSEAGAIVGLNYKADGTGISNCYYNYPSTISGIGYGNTDNGTTRVYKLTLGTGATDLTISGNATYTHNGIKYYAANTTVTVTLGAADKAITSLSATSGTISNVSIAPDGQSATFTVGSSDVTNVTVSATVKTIGGTTEDGLTWSLGGTNYTELTISGTGPMQNYGYTTGNMWKTKAPWGTDITSVTIGDGVTSIGNYAFIGCENVASVTIGSGVTSIGIGGINHCDKMTTVTLPASVTTIAYAAFENCQKLETIYINHGGEVSLTGNHDNAFNAPLLQYIAFSSPAAALANTKETGNWARYKDNIRARFGNQLFTATNEGGTPAYAITNESDLRNLAAAVNAGNDGDGKTFRQTDDITMTGGNFPMIGTNMFCGTYDGGNHDIIGLTISQKYGYIGLFGRIREAAHLHDITLVSPTVTAATTLLNIDLGAVVGACDGNKPVVENCHVINPTVSATSSGKKHVGAIIGDILSNNATVTNCYFYDSNTDHNYAAYGNKAYNATVTIVGRAYAVNILSSGVEATGNGFTHGTDRYLSGTVTLSYSGTPHTSGGWVDTYTVNGTAIEDNPFTINADATIALISTPDPAHFAETADNEYTIYDATGWNVFCDLLEENNQGFFTGKTVVLDKDIAVTRMAGSTNHEFSGTFDGQKHTLTVAITGTVQGTAPFCEIKGATIRNLAVTGSVAGKRHSAGLVGFARGDNSVTNIIENCLVNTSVSITGDNNGYLGGIVGHGFTSALTIRGCAFTGSLTSTSNYTGGLQGWSDGNILTLQNDLFAPTSVNAANAGFHPVAFHNNNSTTTATVSNVYYTVAPTCTQATRIATANAAEQPKQARSVTAGENVTVEAISPVGSSTATYATSGITAYAKGITRGSTFYYGSGDAVSLTLTNTPPTGYAFNGYTTTPDGATLSGSANPYSLTMPDANVTIGATFSFLSIAYIDENGQQQFCTEYTVLSEDFHSFLYAGQWYVVKDDIEYYDNFETWGNGAANIILVDGKTCSIFAGYDFRAIKGNVNIYGQSLGTGTLNLTGGDELIDPDGNSYSQSAIFGNIAVYGGIVTANSGEYQELGSDPAILGNVVCRRGKLTANIGDYAIMGNTVDFSGGELTANGIIHSDVTINWTNSSDRFYANSLSNSVTISNGKAFCYTNNTGLHILGPGPDNGDYILSAEEKAAIAGKTLYPAVAVTLSDGITATGGIITTGDNMYAKVGANATVSVAVPEGYIVSSITVTPAATVVDLGNSSYSFTVPAEDVSVSAQFIMANSIAYIDENGEQQYKQPGEYTVLTGGGATTLDPGWYVVNSDITYTGTVTLGGDVHLILADDCTLNIGSEDDRITSGPCINADGKSLTVYGQTNQTGALKAYSNYEWYEAVKMKDYIQHGGKVIIDHSNGIALYLDGDLTLTRGTLDAKISAYAYAIALGNGHTATVSGGTLNANGASSGYAIRGTLTVSGGTVNATCDGSDVISGNLSMTGGTVNVTNDNEYGSAIEGTLTFSGGNLTANGTIDGNATLSWTSPDDRITVSSYNSKRTVTIADGQVFTDGTSTYLGTLTDAEKTAIANVTLQPATGMTLAAKAVTESDETNSWTNYWTTFYCGSVGFSIDAEENACAYTATVSGETITLHKLGKVIPKNTAVIIVGSDESISMTVSEAIAEYEVEGNHLHGVDVATALDDVKSTYGADAILVLSNKNQHFGFHELATTNVPARKAFLALNGETAKAREFTMVFDDATGIHSIDNGQLIMDNEADAWYSLDGRRLSGKPTQKGLYIHNGRKEELK
jgi:hypothetical protein